MTVHQSDIGHTAQSMLNGKLNYFVGAERLINARDGLGIYANDPDFVVFIAVLNEVEYLRANNRGFDWKRLDNPKFADRLNESIVWAKEISQHHCESLVVRYGSTSSEQE